MGGGDGTAAQVAPGSKWTELMTAVRGFFGELSRDHAAARVSVIAYDDRADAIFTEQEPTPGLADQIEWAGHGTDFGQPLSAAHDLATRS
jgi:hypothetical protein